MRYSPSNLIERVRSSLWLLPVLTLVLSVVAAIGIVWLDAYVQFPLLEAIITKDPASARAVLSVVSTSMLSFTALVFTITMVVLQLASAQYSPRITRTFLRDRETKLTLSVFLATFTFAALVLRSVRSDGEDLVPSLSVGVTYLLVFASLLAFVGYLHHMARSVLISHIMRRIAREADEVLSHLEKAPGPHPDDAADADDADDPWLPMATVVRWPGAAGVVTHVDERGLCGAAKGLGAVVRLRFAIGDFVTRGAGLLEVRGGCEGDAASLCEYVTLGPDRTPQQDLAMPIRNLVDVALRALSPSIHDPTTAVQAIDYLHDLLHRLARSPLPSPFVRDEEGVVRVVIPRMTWEGYVRLVFTEIRLAGAHHVQVCRRLFAMIDDVHEVAREERRRPLEQERAHLEASLNRCFEVAGDRRMAGLGDAQGLGVHFPEPMRR